MKYATHLLKEHFAERCERFVIGEQTTHLIYQKAQPSPADKAQFIRNQLLTSAVPKVVHVRPRLLSRAILSRVLLVLKLTKSKRNKYRFLTLKCYSPLSKASLQLFRRPNNGIELGTLPLWLLTVPADHVDVVWIPRKGSQAQHSSLWMTMTLDGVLAIAEPAAIPRLIIPVNCSQKAHSIPQPHHCYYCGACCCNCHEAMRFRGAEVHQRCRGKGNLKNHCSS